MASWTDLSAAFAYGTKLTSQQMQQLRDNITALAEGASGAPSVEFASLGDFETAGGNGYYNTDHDLGGKALTTQATSWETQTEFRIVLQGTYRFYWGYRCERDNDTAYFRILKNGVVEIGPVADTGTSGGDPHHYRTDDLSLSAGDYIQYQSYVDNSLAIAELLVYLRGNARSGHVDMDWTT
jgi:hypothetical protein